MKAIIPRVTRKPMLCVNRHCRNKTKSPKGTALCSGCRCRRWRIANPKKYAYQNIQYRASKSGIPFDLSYEDFEQFCYETPYMEGKGRHGEGYSVDRINDDPAKGYHGYRKDNIQCLKMLDNIHKYHRKLVYDYRHPELTRIVKVPIPDLGPDEDLPF